MTTYITQDENGHITASADWAFPGSIPADQPVLRGYDGKLYFEGTETTSVLEELKTRKLSILSSAFQTASETAHCASSAGFEINADETANRNVSSLIIAMEATGQQTARFCAYDNTFHTVTLEQLKTLQLEIIAHAQEIYERKWVLREAIEAAQTREELDSIVITFTNGRL